MEEAALEGEVVATLAAVATTMAATVEGEARLSIGYDLVNNKFIENLM